MRKARSGSAAPAAMIGALRFVEADIIYTVYAETIALPMRVRELIEYLATPAAIALGRVSVSVKSYQ
jgi:hypothetical protein